ncbi:MAG TPA: YcaO-like family protein [Beutenbergiaceae bacterium]|nr:YcaO-like family protein [Beutenbergiaceae bacterium]
MGRVDASDIADVRKLVSRRTGLISQCVPLESFDGSGDWYVYASSLGNLDHIVSGIEHAADAGADVQLGGAGTAVTTDHAADIAAVEGLERYSSCVWDDLPTRWASERQMRESGDSHLDVMTLATVGENESRTGRAVISKANLDRPLRWIRGINLHNRTPAWVPLICTYLFVNPITLGERIWTPISTGCATYSNAEGALLAGLLEAVERESIALVWLQKLPCPRLDTESLDPPAVDFIREFERRGATVSLMDATTDLGVPTIYCLIRRESQHAAQIVTCASATNGSEAALKALREAQSTLVAIETNSAPVPDDVMDFHDTIHGAVYMAHRSRREHFDFLDSSRKRTRVAEMPRLPDDTGEALAEVLRRLRRLDMEAYAVDITTDEGARSGFTSVKVLVPELIPLSFVHSTRYLGTSRLYGLPEHFGRDALPEKEINPWPQPFA